MSQPARSPSQVAILIPAYGAADKLQVCLQSLIACVSADCLILVLDDGTPDSSIADCCLRQQSPNVTYIRSDINRGFVATCNWGLTQAPRNSDILLLNSDTEVTPGFLDEMLRVLYLHERHAVVCPRSNNATIFSIPVGNHDCTPQESFAIWQRIKTDLPGYTMMPTAVGFCMLIKADVLLRFGLFDEVYSPGYNEENDFVCRINRYGYCALAANHAFVYHFESSTFGTRRRTLEAEHARILNARYPEYQTKVTNYLQFELDPLETFAILHRPRRPALFYDLFHLPPKYTGSSEFALSLLREIYIQTEDEWDLYVGVGEEARFFASELHGYQLFEDRPDANRVFDLAFKPAQIFTWAEFKRMHRLSPRLSFVLQDIIAVRSDILAYPARRAIFFQTVQMADQVITISDFTRSDFEAYFNVHLPSQTIHHGTNAGLTPSEAMRGEFVLVVGNNFAHKGVREVVPYLANAGPVKILGGDSPPGSLPANIEWLQSGQLTRNHIRELYAKANVLVYPSYYEGFGLPIVEGLALGKPVIALDNQLNRELRASLGSKRLILVQTFDALQSTLATFPQSVSTATLPLNMRRWSDVASDYVTALRALLNQAQSPAKLRARSQLIRTLHAANHL